MVLESFYLELAIYKKQIRLCTANTILFVKKAFGDRTEDVAFYFSLENANFRRFLLSEILTVSMAEMGDNEIILI